MAKRKYYSIILIILLITVMALAHESTTVNGIMANYTELNTSRIFRIYDNSLNEILLSEDALYLSHVNGGINEIRIGSTDTQFSKQIDMLGNDIINCGNCDTPDNLKVNKSGDNMTGNINYISPYNPDMPAGFSGLNDLTPLMPNSFYGKMVYTFGVNRYLNATGHWQNGTYTNATGVAFTLDSKAGTSKMPVFQLAYFFGNSTSYTYWFQSDNRSTRILEGNLTITAHKTSGAGYEYICVEKSTGTYINSSIGCDLI